MTGWLLVLACGRSDGEPIAGDREFIAPADGQTGIEADLPLRIVAPSLEIPPGYPIGDLITVVDVGAETQVAGGTVVENGEARFLPDAPWTAGATYVWGVFDLEAWPHGPEYDVPEVLVGDARFVVEDTLDLLGATLERTTEPCLVFSEPVLDRAIDEIELRVEGRPIPWAEVWPMDGEWWRDPYELLPSDAGIDVICFDTGEELLAPDVPVQVVWDGHEWVRLLERRRPGGVVAELRRAE
jgi:hypothetical protein